MKWTSDEAGINSRTAGRIIQMLYCR